MRLYGTSGGGVYLHPAARAPICIAATTPPRIFAWRWRRCVELPAANRAYCTPDLTRDYGDRIAAYLPAEEEI
jgi:hypothetical protein